jgi:hypothetical protein
MESPAEAEPIGTSARKPSPTCTNQNTEEKAQTDLHQSEHQTGTRSLTCTHKNIKKKGKPNLGTNQKTRTESPA